ncbi:MAG: type II toxin-antitoxin system VapC family toxin [Methylococcales bacterium]|nr:type II toxin-antitoxin system VapC family toxin [Methylococcales bacterium]
MYLLDTNILIYFFKGQGNVSQHLAMTPPETLFVSTITLFELYTGIAKSTLPEKRTLQLQALLARITVLGFNERAAIMAAEIRSVLEKQGTPIGVLDVLIASVALTNGLTVVTHNTKEFTRIKELQLVDWY